MFNRTEIMTAAWVIVRRFKGNRETHAQRISRALSHVWWQAKEAARLARNVAARAAAKVAELGAMSASQLRGAIVDLENRDGLRWADLNRLTDLHAALGKATFG
jgi:hypothetical protein